MKIYLIGKATTGDAEQKELFNLMQQQMERAGHGVHNIYAECPNINELNTRRQINQRIAGGLLHCEAAYLLPGFNEDSIAQLELITALHAQIQVYCVKGVATAHRMQFIIPIESFHQLNDDNNAL